MQETDNIVVLAAGTRPNCNGDQTCTSSIQKTSAWSDPFQPSTSVVKLYPMAGTSEPVAHIRPFRRLKLLLIVLDSSFLYRYNVKL